MKNLLCFSVLLLLILQSASCTVDRSANATFKRTTNYSCRGKQKNVFLFYEGDSVNFKFKQLGLIEISGKAGDSDQDILDRLKYTAYLNCANAIIHIKTTSSSKNYGNDFRTDTRTYESKTYKGLAVRIEPDSLYKSKAFGNWQDLGFMKNTISYHQHRKEKAIKTTVAALLVSALLVGIYVKTAYHP